MSRYRGRFSGIGIGGGWTPAVKTIVTACVVVFILQHFDRWAGGTPFDLKFGLTPADITGKYFLWQLVTYIFLHAGVFHILFNMLGLYMFGSELETTWGTRQFTKYFFICGIGAAIATVLVGPYSLAMTVGASG